MWSNKIQVRSDGHNGLNKLLNTSEQPFKKLFSEHHNITGSMYTQGKCFSQNIVYVLWFVEERENTLLGKSTSKQYVVLLGLAAVVCK